MRISQTPIKWLPLVLFLAACGGAEQSSSEQSTDGRTGDPSGNSTSGGTTTSGGVGGSGGSGGSSGSGTGGGGGATPPISPPGSGAGGSTVGAGGTSGGGAGTGSGGSTGGTGGSTGGTGGGPVGQPGLLTAGAWDDNRNFDRFLRYRGGLAAQRVPGLLPIADADHASARDRASAPLEPHDRLDISFVIDTTGSMGDELRYLQTEFLAISQTIAERYPNAEPRWSLVLYRDLGDEYVVRAFDFDGDPQAFQTRLAAQRAGGGGDTPEAPERGLGEMVSFGWRAEPSVAKIAFWVADAPHHAQNAQALGSTILQSRATGIHIYPVASSGVDEFTELTMRTAAQLTGGRYLFLTNDSGVGNSHKEPSIPCYFVTRLDNAMLRMIDIELSGVYHEPAPAEIIRTGGNPQNGACALASGESAIVF